jgi:hypothetical protein
MNEEYLTEIKKLNKNMELSNKLMQENMDLLSCLIAINTEEVIEFDDKDIEEWERLAAIRDSEVEKKNTEIRKENVRAVAEVRKENTEIDKKNAEIRKRNTEIDKEEGEEWKNAK